MEAKGAPAAARRGAVWRGAVWRGARVHAWSDASGADARVGLPACSPAWQLRSLVNEGTGNNGADSDGTVSPPSNDDGEVLKENVDTQDLRDVEEEVTSISDKEATLQVPWRWPRCGAPVCSGHDGD